MISLVYRGKQPAIVNQVLIQGQDRSILTAFMDEIRVCANLEHPKVIRFFGIMWTSLWDLAAVVEYAPNGNLAVYLKAKSCSQESPHSTFAWMTSSIESPSKLLFALQASEALVYLQSFAPPIIHGHSKAESYMLGSTWELKLDRIGCRLDSSLLSIEDRVWTAPKVAMSANFDEKADVYSFGVILSELDRCKLPFSSKNVRRQNIDAMPPKPKFRQDCPPEMLEIAQICLKDNSVNRPTAVELRHSLHFLLRQNLGQKEASIE